MNGQYYELLGLTENATDEEIEARYQELKAKYNEERWLDGEAGNEAAKMLGRLDTAYEEICASRREKATHTGDDTALYKEISELLKADKLNEAQAMLDNFNERGAEWHYLQAVVFYKKNWSNESKKQLEIAMEIDPQNTKYRNAYEKLNAKQEYQKQQPYGGHSCDPNGSPYQGAGNPYSGSQPDRQMGGGNICGDCLTCCYANLCINCLFNLCCGCH